LREGDADNAVKSDWKKKRQRLQGGNRERGGTNWQGDHPVGSKKKDKKGKEREERVWEMLEHRRAQRTLEKSIKIPIRPKSKRGPVVVRLERALKKKRGWGN